MQERGDEVVKSINEKFGEEFFNGGIKIPGRYEKYQYEEFYLRFRALAITIKHLFNPTRVLDVGCAKGFLVKAFEDIGVHAWGVDVSEYAISKAPKEIKSKLYRVDLNKDYLPFKDEYFDFVTFLGTIEYLDNHEHAINEIKRVLKRGGGLYLTTIFRRCPEDKIRINVHDRKYWIKEFESSGFRFEPQKTNNIILF